MWIVLKLRLGIDLNGLGIETHNITLLLACRTGKYLVCK